MKITFYSEDWMNWNKREIRIKWPKDLSLEIGAYFKKGRQKSDAIKLNIKNFSRRGMFLETDCLVDVKAGMELDFWIDDPGKSLNSSQDTLINGHAIVRWVRSSSIDEEHLMGFGIYVMSLSPDSYEKYLDIFAQQLQKMKVSDLFVRGVPTVDVNTSLIDAISLVQREKIKSVVVIDNIHKPIGILSIQDIMKGINIFELQIIKVSDIFRGDFFSVESHEDMNLAVDILKSGCRYDIVVLKDGFYFGVLPYEDVVSYWVSLSEFLYEKVQKNAETVLAEVAHELRSPVTYLLAVFEMLKSKDPQFVDVFSNEISKSVEQTFDLIQSQIENLLDQARIRRGQIKLKLVEVSIDKFLYEVVQKLNFFAAKRGVRIELCGIIDDVVVSIDAGCLEQIISNIVNNAVYFSKREDVVKLRAEVSPGGLTLIVEDKGQGIHPEVLNRISRSAETPFIEGLHNSQSTGLGLNIVRKILVAMNGKMSICSNFGQGSVFAIFIPCSVKSQIMKKRLLHESNDI